MRYTLTLLFCLLWSATINAQTSPQKFTNLDVFDLEYASDPQISPDGSRIVYVRNSMDIMRDGKKSHLWILNADGSGHQKLTGRETRESSPRWSPDGSRIAFSSSTDEGSEVYVYWWLKLAKWPG